MFVILKQVIVLTNSTKSFIIKISNDDERFSKKFRIKINFELFNELIYYIKNKIRRLCFLINVKSEIFRLIYNENYNFQLSKKIRRNIKYCFNC